MKGKLPTEDELWEHRHTRGWSAWSEETGLDRHAIANAYPGWGCDKRSRPGFSLKRGSYISQAPCSCCPRTNIPVEELTDERVCDRCIARDEALEEEAGITREQLELERLRSLERQGLR